MSCIGLIIATVPCVLDMSRLLLTWPPAVSTLSLHDALPIWWWRPGGGDVVGGVVLQRDPRRAGARRCRRDPHEDRKSTRLNSSHSQISYAVFCLKKKTVPGVHSSSLCCVRHMEHRLHDGGRS